MKLAMIRAWLGIVLGMAAAPAFADSFSFSYSFAAYETKVTGTFTGVQNGLFVENISDLTLSIDGNLVPSSLFGSRWDENSGWVGDAIISFNRFDNNFAFSDADMAGGDMAFSYLFYMVPNAVWLGTQLETPDLFAWDDESNPGTWTLTNLSTSTSVPDGGVTAGLFLLALASLRLLRRSTAA